MNDFLGVKLADLDEKIVNGMQIITGVVAKTEPLVIQINDKLFLTEDFLVLTSAVKKYKSKINNEIVIIDNSLSINETVIMLKQQGGQSYYIIDKEREL